MKVHSRIGFFVCAWVFILFCVSWVAVCCANPSGSLVWETQVSSSGVEVVSPVLQSGVSYRVVVNGTWVYDASANLAADAQYYTTDYHDTWLWGNYSQLPNGESFLQIDGQNVYWGPFINGMTGHTYVKYLSGEGKSVSFRIFDWMDGNPGNVYCHLDVSIYQELTVGGYLQPVIVPGVSNVSWMVNIMLFAAVLIVPALVYYKKRAH